MHIMCLYNMYKIVNSHISYCHNVSIYYQMILLLLLISLGFNLWSHLHLRLLVQIYQCINDNINNALIAKQIYSIKLCIFIIIYICQI